MIECSLPPRVGYTMKLSGSTGRTRFLRSYIVDSHAQSAEITDSYKYYSFFLRVKTVFDYYYPSKAKVSQPRYYLYLLQKSFSIVTL